MASRSKGTNSDSTQGALAGMAKVGNPRIPMGQGAITLSSVAPPLKGKLVPKGHGKGGDYSGMGTTGNKTGVLANEHLGARHGISVRIPAGMQQSQQVLANSRIVPNVMGSRPNFDEQVMSYGSWGPR